MKPRIAALVPMRHHSVRVPGKNYRDFAGRKLYHHIIENLLACSLISDVIIDTDSPVLKDDCAKYFPKVRIFDRPEHLRADTIPMNDVLLNDVKQIEADFYLQTHSTNPLLSAKTITAAIETFFKNQPAFDSLFGVTRIQARLWDANARAVNHDPSVLLRTQDLPPIYLENSCIYIFTRNTLESRGNRIGQKPFMFEIDPIEACDIDNELEFRMAECLYRELRGDNR
jgi:CMP-N-acetylneuraminic acid synthetase